LTTFPAPVCSGSQINHSKTPGLSTFGHKRAPLQRLIGVNEETMIKHRSSPMSRTSKFIASVVAASKEDMPALPFQRGATRKAMFARIKAESTNLPNRKRA
jgi:hypothetical protein